MLVITHSNGSLLGSTSLYPGSSTPASPKETVVLYAVGFGLPAAALVNESATQSGSLPVLPICQVLGAAATLAFAGLICPGLYQLNLTISATAANGDNAVSCTYNGATTPAGALIMVQSSTPVPTPLTLLDAVTSNQTGTPNNVCTLPPSITSFQTTAPGVYLFFDVNGAVAGDMETTTFYRPDGVAISPTQARLRRSESMATPASATKSSLPGIRAHPIPASGPSEQPGITRPNPCIVAPST